MTRAEIEDLVADLHVSAASAAEPVLATSRMAGPAGGETLVVDRAGWARSNAESFGALVDPIVARSGPKPPSGPFAGPVTVAARSVTALETGALLAFVSTKVLGQFDVLRPDGRRLLLVAPNIARVERELGVAPEDFRLWVCLHEETHRVQFSSSPWLAGWFTSQVQELLEDFVEDPGSALDRLGEAIAELPDLIRALAGSPGSGGAGLLDLVQSPEQKARLDQLTAVMSLLEGHADVVMDEVGPAVVPSVAEIRRRFTRRRTNGTGPLDRTVRRALGLDAKAAQYRSGAAFVRGVVDEVGIDGFNEVWRSPETLPTPAEIREPATWVRRVHA
jgi:coenzyme F420 biosynthesis associated uncharacterized protein